MKKNRKKIWTIISIAIIAIYFLWPVIFSDDTTPVLAPPTPTQQVLGEQSGWYQLYFTSPKNLYDKVTNGGIEENLIKLIDSSTTTIDAAYFEFDLDNLAQAIERAKKRGVQVRLVYDNEHSDSDPQTKQLISLGIPAVPDERSAFMHNKFFIIDRQCVWTGSFNYTVNAAYKNNENAIVICDPRLVDNYETEFSEMFTGQFGTTSPSNTPYSSFDLNGILIENYFAPEDDVMDKVISTVTTANKSIHFLAFSFTDNKEGDNKLAETMIARQKMGISVSGVFEIRGADADSSECATLLKSGAQIALDGNPYTLHHKVIIVDSQTVIFGSFNFSISANKNNDENLLIIHDPKLASEFENEFQKRLEEATLLTGTSCKK